MNTWWVEFFEDQTWQEFTANTGVTVYFANQVSAKAIAKFVAIGHNRYPTNFLSWRVADSKGNKYSIF